MNSIEVSSERARSVFDSTDLGQDWAKAEAIKSKAAELWDLIDSIDVSHDTKYQAGRHVSVAKTELESSVMWSIKALSRSNQV